VDLAEWDKWCFKTQKVISHIFFFRLSCLVAGNGAQKIAKGIEDVRKKLN